MTRRLALALGSLLALGCAENAVLEVELMLPAQPSTGAPLFAYVQARSAEVVSFDDAWAGSDAVEGRALEAARGTLPFSIVAGGASLPRELGVRVRFCASPDCTGLGDDRAPEARFRIERAFYLGRRTRLVLSADPIPTGTATIEDIDKCQVEGCTTGSTTTYCFMNGHHFCEE